VYFCLGESYLHLKGNEKTAYENFKKPESLTDNKEILMYIYYKIGRALQSNFNLDDALSYYNESLILAKDLGNRNMQAANLRNIAGIYYGFANRSGKKEELDKALNYYDEFLNLDTNKEGEEGKISTSLNTNEKARLLACNSSSDRIEMLSEESTYHFIATIYDKKGDYLKAAQSLQKGIEICEKHGNYYTASHYRLELGERYRKIKDYENAEKYFLEAIEGFKKLRDKKMEVEGYKHLADLYMDKGDEQKAQESYERIRDIRIRDIY
jgi:TolA-binding protein